MGLETREGGKYITILGGKFCIRVPEGTEGSAPRVNKLGNTVHEKYYDSFTGKLINIRTRESVAYGKNWEFDFQDEKDVYTLQLSYSNSYATAFLKMLPNIDLNQKMKVQPSQKIEDGKTKSSLFISQDGVNIKHAYTKDNPNGMPDMEQVTVKGNLVWDDTKRLAFLAGMVEQDIMPKLPKASAAPTTSSPAEGLAVDQNSAPVGEVEDEDDY